MVKKEYSPIYKKGEILICFWEGNEEIGKARGEMLGCRLLEKYLEFDNTYLFYVGEGNEDKFVKIFSDKKYEKIIHYAERRDLKWENRLSFKDSLIHLTENIDEDLPKKAFRKNLNSIIQQIEEFNDDPSEKDF